jgi:microsomal dipeptidase-like Zn-dependent dipeptidase
MNSRKVRNSCFVVCLSVLLGFSWSAQGADLPVLSPFTPKVMSAPLPAGAAPASVTVLAAEPQKVIITWAAVAGASSYTVWKGASSTLVNQVIGTVAAAGPLRLEYGQLLNSTMYYRVSANYPNLNPGWSAVVAGTTPPVGINPSGFTASAGAGGDVILNWRPVPNAISYILVGPGFPPLSSSFYITGTTYTVKRLPAGTNSWNLWAVYKAPSGGVYLGDESNPTRISMTVRMPIWGYADLHNHQFANLGFGGLMLSGKPFDPGGIEMALPHCDFKNGNPTDWIHGPGGIGDLIGVATEQGTGHLVGGYPEFDGWPRWNSTTHQQVYVDWLKRAKDGGLRLMVMLSVNNEVLCSLVKRAPGRGCGDMEAVDLQLAGAKALEAYVDQLSGGPGRGWYRIVRSPQEARDAIAKGQLAVVLGIEVDNLFGCRVGASCDDAYLRGQLQKYYELGVRHAFPIHLTNNAFGGAAVYDDTFNWLNAVLTGSFFEVEGCTSRGVQFKFSKSSMAIDAFGILFKNTYSKLPALPTYPNQGQCNTRGLTDRGKFLVREMMKRHMVIDVDHMSGKAFEDTLNIAEEPQNRYPLASGHTGIMEVSVGNKRSEYQKNLNQIGRIRNLGGLVAIIPHQGETAGSSPTDGIASWPNPAVRNDCSNSSKTFAQAYQFAVMAMGGRTEAAVAFGTDFNGLAKEPGPRFGDPQLGIEACPGGIAAEKSAQLDMSISRPVDYPFTLPGMPTLPKLQSRNKVFDINRDGLAHIGLLPDFIQDLRRIRLTDEELSPLFRSAEAYITMWEKTYAIH